MSIRTRCVSLCAGTLLAAPPVFGDFQAALREYNAGHYELAHAQFLALAELGDCSSQFNLGAMALKAQGGAADPGSAADIFARYGREALRTQGIINPDFDCKDENSASALETPAAEYPRVSGERPQRALVITALTIGVAVKLLAGEIQSDPQSLGWDTRAMAQRLAAYRGGKSWQGELFAAG
jgi:hypothetical protein